MELQRLGLYDISIIGWKLKMLLIVQQQVLCSILEDGDIGNITPCVSNLNIKSNKTLSEIKLSINMAIINCISGPGIGQALSDIGSLGYPDPPAALNEILSRVDMLYTILKISEDEYNVIFV